MRIKASFLLQLALLQRRWDRRLLAVVQRDVDQREFELRFIESVHQSGVEVRHAANARNRLLAAQPRIVQNLLDARTLLGIHFQHSSDESLRIA